MILYFRLNIHEHLINVTISNEIINETISKRQQELGNCNNNKPQPVLPEVVLLAIWSHLD